MMSRELIDKYVNKFISRKLIVWLTATGFLWFGKVDASNWITLSLVYIGSTAVIEMVNCIRSGGNQ